MRTMDNERLIKLVFERKVLWDVRDRNYHNRDFSRKLWNEIATELDCTSHVVKSKWQNLRDTYRKEYMKLIRTSGDPNSRGPHWKYFDRLSFLNDVLALRKRPTQSLLSAAKRRRPSSTTASIDADQAATDDNDNEDTDEYTDINPLRYLCEVPQLTTDENEDASSQHDTVSNDANSGTDQDNNNNQNCDKSNFDFRKNPKSVKKKTLLFQPETNTLLDDDTVQNADYHLYDDFYMNHDQYDLLNAIGASNTNISGFGKSTSNYDEDYHFLMSILPHLREIPKNRKLHVRQKLQEVIMNEQELISSSIRAEQTQIETTVATSHQPPYLSPQTGPHTIKILQEVNNERNSDENDESNRISSIENRMTSISDVTIKSENEN